MTIDAPLAESAETRTTVTAQPSRKRAIRALVLGIASLASYRVMPVLLIIASMVWRIFHGLDFSPSSPAVLNLGIYLTIGVGLLVLAWAIYNVIRNRAFLRAGTKGRGFFIAALVCTAVATCEVLGYGAIWLFFWLSPRPSGD